MGLLRFILGGILSFFLKVLKKGPFGNRPITYVNQQRSLDTRYRRIFSEILLMRAPWGHPMGRRDSPMTPIIAKKTMD